MSSRSFLPSLASVTFFIIAVYALLRWQQIPIGELVDWLTGIAIAWWLLAVVTIPWNMHFEAKALVDEARTSEQKGIAVQPDDVAYAHKIANRYRQVAIGLHLVSAVGLALMAYLGLTPLGYIAAVVALLLTFLRPLMRMFEYVVARLAAIRQQIHYPRDDVYELLNKVGIIEDKVTNLEEKLNADSEYSFISGLLQRLGHTESTLQDLRVALENLRVDNAAEHQRVIRQAESTIARLSEDAQFLNQVREIIRFWKQV
jgi:hypothetical protein